MYYINTETHQSQEFALAKRSIFYDVLCIASCYNRPTNELVYAYERNGVKYFTSDYKYAFALDKVFPVTVAPFDYLVHKFGVPNKGEFLDNILLDLTSELRKHYMIILLTYDYQSKFVDNVFFEHYKRILSLNIESGQKSIGRAVNLYLKHRAQTMTIEQDVMQLYKDLLIALEYDQSESQEPDLISCKVIIDIDKTFHMNALDVFNQIECNEEVPYVEVLSKEANMPAHWIKTYNDIEFPSKEFSFDVLRYDEGNQIVMLIKDEKKTDPSSSKIEFDRLINSYYDGEYSVRFVHVTYNARQRTIIYEHNVLSRNDKLDIAKLVIKHMNLPKDSYFIYSMMHMYENIIPNKYIYIPVMLLMMRMNPQFDDIRKYVYIDEHRSSAMMNGYIKLKIITGTSKVTVRINSKIAKKQFKWNNVVIRKGWSYLKIVYYKIPDMDVIHFIDNVVRKILYIYEELKPIYKSVFNISDGTFYTGNEDKVGEEPMFIDDLREEVPEIWVPNTSRQISKDLRIINEKHLETAIKENYFILQFPIPVDDFTERVSRYYTSVNKKGDGAYVGLLENIKENRNVIAYLPNVYMYDHSQNKNSLLHVYLKDPTKYNINNKPKTRQQFYTFDNKPRMDVGYTNCPKIIVDVVYKNIYDSSSNLYLYATSGNNNRFEECLITACGIAQANIMDYAFMCRQELPGKSDDEIMELMKTNINPMYFVRAYEVVYNVNIIIVISKRSELYLFPPTSSSKYRWVPDPSKPIILLMCYSFTRFKFYYQLVCRSNKYLHGNVLWTVQNHPEEYKNITTFYKKHVNADDYDNIDLTNYIAQSISKDGRVLSFLTKNGDTEPADYHSTCMSIVVDNKVASKFDAYIARKNFVDMSHDALLNLMYHTDIGIKILEQNVEYVDRLLYDDVNYMMDEFYINRCDYHKYIMHYNNIGLMKNGKLQFLKSEMKTISNIVHSILNGEKIKYIVNQKCMYLKNKKNSNTLLFSSSQAYMDWRLSRDYVPCVMYKLKRINKNYILSCLIDQNEELFLMLMSYKNDQILCEKYIDDHFPNEYTDIAKIFTLNDLIYNLKGVEDKSSVMLLYRYKKNLFCPIIYIDRKSNHVGT